MLKATYTWLENLLSSSCAAVDSITWIATLPPTLPPAVRLALVLICDRINLVDFSSAEHNPPGRMPEGTYEYSESLSPTDASANCPAARQKKSTRFSFFENHARACGRGKRSENTERHASKMRAQAHRRPSTGRPLFAMQGSSCVPLAPLCARQPWSLEWSLDPFMPSQRASFCCSKNVKPAAPIK